MAEWCHKVGRRCLCVAVAALGHPLTDRSKTYREGGRKRLLSFRSLLKRDFASGARKFNSTKPSAVVEVLLAEKFIANDSPAEISRFLHEAAGAGIHRDKLGDFLGHRYESSHSLIFCCSLPSVLSLSLSL